MSALVLPNRLTIRLLAASRNSEQAANYLGSPIAFMIRTFARKRNDYHLGPFFSTASALTVTQSDFRSSVGAALDWGLMDHHAIGDSFSLVEIHACSGDEVRRMATARRANQGFSRHEVTLWESLDGLLARLDSCANHQLDPLHSLRIRDEWDSAVEEREYDLFVQGIR